ncbi:hypothetical protein ScPMuIL_005765 [Solemya velum]
MSAHEIEDFYGVYLLYNLNPKYKGRTYIGFTVNPNRRIKQHNTGRHAGGAKRTDGKGPWEMILIVHGFPNEISALRFEWAWTYPHISRRLRNVVGKRKKELLYECVFKFRILSEMLRIGPWKRLSLTVRWLKQEYQRDFLPELSPPVHMAIAYGPVRIKKSKETGSVKSSSTQNNDDIPVLTLPTSKCYLCFKKFQTEDTTVSCFHRRCMMVSHITCLSKHFLQDAGDDRGQLMPVEGHCPKCKQPVLWGDVIRHKNGCYHNLEEFEDVEDSDENHWANQLQEET